MNQARHDIITLADSLVRELTNTLTEAGRNITGEDAEAALSRGKVFQLSNYLHEAISSYQSALACDPCLDEAKARLAVVQSLALQRENALATAMELAQSNPGFELKEMTSDRTMTAMTLLGDVLVKNDRIRDALEAYKVASTRYKNDSFAAGRLAQAYLASGEPQKAIDEVPNFEANPRFLALQKILTLGRETAALLPKYGPGDMKAMIAVTEHGRPMVIGAAVYVAPLVAADSDWCTCEK